MAKVRKKKPTVASLPDGIEFCEVATAEMVVFTERNLKDFETADLKGKFVKVSPTIQSSKRHTFPVDQIVDSANQRGAIAVVVSPVIVPDGKKAKATKDEVSKQSVDDMINAWISEQNIPEDMREELTEFIVSLLVEEGL